MIKKLNEPFYCIDEGGHTDASSVPEHGGCV